MNVGNGCLVAILAVLLALLLQKQVHSVVSLIDCDAFITDRSTKPWWTSFVLDPEDERRPFVRCEDKTKTAKACGASLDKTANQPDFSICPGQYFYFDEGRELLLCHKPQNKNSEQMSVSIYAEKNLAALKAQLESIRLAAQRAKARELQRQKQGKSAKSKNAKTLEEPQLQKLDPLPKAWEGISKILCEGFTESKTGDECKA